MQEEDFNSVQALLRERGLIVDESRYERNIFGSWYVYVGTDPRLGLVWDGRDGWLYVRREGDGKWDDLWLGREPSDHTPAAAVDTLLRFVR